MKSETRAEKYICAFRGRRDDYQVPVALAEAGRLESFITDAYAMPWVRKLGGFFPGKVHRAFEFRYSRGIPEDRVHCLWGTAAVERLRHRLGYSPVLTWSKLDQVYSRAAERAARCTRANLFLYSPYAWEAFRAQYTHTPRKVLFEYHPHPSLETRLLAEDVATFPEVQHSYTEATGSRLPVELRKRIADAWTLADLIVCASSFTKQTVVSAGADAGKCVVIPYGVQPLKGEESAVPRRGFHALFVGSGVQRKGLHHLLRAWKIAKLDSESYLTLVCRNLDPGLEALVAASPRTRLIRGTTAMGLSQLYSESTLFVMPSLIEGFGQVYLEALSLGCPVLGTTNTCLPDLGGEEDGVFLTPVGDWEKLAGRLEELAGKNISGAKHRERAQMCSRQFTWERFRSQLQSVL